MKTYVFSVYFPLLAAGYRQWYWLDYLNITSTGGTVIPYWLSHNPCHTKWCGTFVNTILILMCLFDWNIYEYICIYIILPYWSNVYLAKIIKSYVMEEWPGPRLNINTVFPRYWIPMLKIRRSRDRLIINISIPILVRRHLYIETAPSLPKVANKVSNDDLATQARTSAATVLTQYTRTILASLPE